MPFFDYLRYFPYKKIRDQQEQAIDFALNAYLKENKKIVILEAGTGVGKSAIAMTIGKYLTTERYNEYIKNDANNHDFYRNGTLILTPQKSLQDQYCSDFELNSITSAQNYYCKFNRMTCAKARFALTKIKTQTDSLKPSTIGDIHNCGFNCKYARDKDKFLSEDHSIANFAYFLTNIRFNKTIQKKFLLVLDEAHSIENELSKIAGITIRTKFCQEELLIDSFPENDLDLIVNWCSKEYSPKLNKLIKETEDSINDDFIDPDDKVKLSNILMDYENNQSEIYLFMQNYALDKENWVTDFVFNDEKKLLSIELKPINVGLFLKKYFLDYGRFLLLMSATILDKKMFCESIGLEEDDVAFLSLRSPFPAENRPIHYVPAGKMTKDKIDETLPFLVEMIKEILNEHKNQKGIIHCRSFKVSNYIKKNLYNPRLLFHDSNDKKKVLERHLKSSSPTVFVSPSSTEGLDLKDDLSRFQIICKIEYPYMGDPLVLARKNKSQKWYEYQAVKSLIQSCGRSIRNENDRAITYILDSSWDMFYKRNKKFFPDYIKEIIDISAKKELE